MDKDNFTEPPPLDAGLFQRFLLALRKEDPEEKDYPDFLRKCRKHGIRFRWLKEPLPVPAPGKHNSRYTAKVTDTETGESIYIRDGFTKFIPEK